MDTHNDAILLDTHAALIMLLVWSYSRGLPTHTPAGPALHILSQSDQHVWTGSLEILHLHKLEGL